jgi:hypothetical protein
MRNDITKLVAYSIEAAREKLILKQGMFSLIGVKLKKKKIQDKLIFN